VLRNVISMFFLQASRQVQASEAEVAATEKPDQTDDDQVDCDDVIQQSRHHQN